MQTSRSFVRFALSILVAPLAGAAAAFVIAFAFTMIAGTAAERTREGSTHLAVFTSFWTYFICLAYTVVIGSAAYAFATIAKRRLSVAIALMIGLVAGAVPFTILSLSRETASAYAGKTLFFPILAVVCSLVTAWTFWTIALSTPLSADAASADSALIS